MMKTIGIICFFLLLTACGNRSVRTSGNNGDDLVKSIRPQLDSLFIDAAKEISEFEENRGRFFNSFLLTFSVNPEESLIYFSDSTVKVSAYYCGFNYDSTAYKGVLSVDDYIIAVFDKESIGHKYYNQECLLSIPFDELECNNINVILNTSFYIKDGKLELWNP